MAAVILRLNDWVPQVRRAAETCAERVFPQTAAPPLARALLGLANRKERWQRWPQEPDVLATTEARADVTASLIDLSGQASSGV